jgi:hypothetical protein
MGTKLRKQLITWLGNAQPTGWGHTAGSLTVADLEDLAKLGYAGGPEETASTDWFEACDE